MYFICFTFLAFAEFCLVSILNSSQRIGTACLKLPMFVSRVQRKNVNNSVDYQLCLCYNACLLLSPVRLYRELHCIVCM